MPSYTTGKKPFTVPGVVSDVCPVSVITPQSRQLVQIHARARKVEGATLYGPDLRNWPARMVDAFSCLESQRIAVHNAEISAE